VTSRTQLRRRLLAAALPGAVAAALVTIPATPAQAAPSTTIVINEVYGGGGNSGATYTNDFIELKNIGSTDVDVSTWSVQYASGGATGTNYQVTKLTGHIPAGETYLVEEAAGTGGTTPLPAPDVKAPAGGGIAMSGTAGKVALVSSQTALSCTIPNCDTAPGVVDYVGYGSAVDSETAPTPAPSNTMPVSRTGGDTDNNSTDFTTGAPSPDSCGAVCVTEEPPPPPTGECGDPATFIHQIQGSGAAFDPAFGGTRIIEGVATAVMLGGVFVQEEAADVDTDPQTSEGIFVFLSGQTPPQEGSLVRVLGTVAEFGGKTQLTDVTVKSCAAVPTPIVPTPVTFPVASTTDLERFEGMQVELTQEMVISEYFNYARFGEVVVGLPLVGQDRLFTPTAVVEPGDAARALAAEYARRIITIDDVSTAQNPSAIPHPGNGEPFSLTNRFRGGDAITGIQGILDDSFNRYRIQPTVYGTYTAKNARPADAPAVGGQIQVASFNVLNYFLTLDQGTNKCGPALNQDCRGADDAAERTRQRDKILAALTKLDADVVGLMEMENSPGVEPAEDLVAGLNERLGAGTYTYVDTGVVGTDAIRVGMLYKPGTVTPVGTFDILNSADDPRFDDTKSRPMLTQTFDEVSSGERFTVSVNHLKSKGSACTGDADTGDGQGNCNETRTQAAEAIVDHLAEDPTSSGDPDHLIIGDLNSYDHEDPIDALVAGGFTDMVKQFNGEYAYSYVFDGMAGYLDHALASTTLVGQVSGAAEWHINADEPSILDYDMSFKPPAVDALYAPDPYRASDHDAVLVGLNLQSPDEVALSAAAVPSSIVFGQTATVQGTLTKADDGAPVSGATVTLESRVPGAVDWTPTASTATTGTDGGYSFTVSPSRNLDYRVVYDGDTANKPSQSGPVHVDVATRVTITASDTTTRKGDTVTFFGVVAPNHAGQSVLLQRQVNGAWTTVSTTTLDADSSYVLRYTFGSKEKKNSSAFRVVKPADGDHVTGTSASVTVTVR